MPMFGPTTDHEEIRRWAAVYGAVPVEVGTAQFDSEPTKLGFIFPKGGGVDEPEFKPITWEAFFALFDLMQLSLVYDDDRPGTYELLQADAREQSGFAVGSS